MFFIGYLPYWYLTRRYAYVLSQPTDFDKSFPPTGFEYKQVALKSLHAKQMCWEEDGGSLSTVVDEVQGQLEFYVGKRGDVTKDDRSSKNSGVSANKEESLLQPQQQ